MLLPNIHRYSIFPPRWNNPPCMNMDEKTVRAGWTGCCDSNVRRLYGIAPKAYVIVFIAALEASWEKNTAIFRIIIPIVMNGNIWVGLSSL